MKFWDSSAIVPLVFSERTTPEALQWYRDDSHILVWALTSTEVVSALYRRFREGSLVSMELSDSSQLFA